MQRLEVSGAVRPIYGSLGVKRLSIDSVPVKFDGHDFQDSHRRHVYYS